jgi:hypothetical protein
MQAIPAGPAIMSAKVLSVTVAPNVFNLLVGTVNCG